MPPAPVISPDICNDSVSSTSSSQSSSSSSTDSDLPPPPNMDLKILQYEEERKMNIKKSVDARKAALREHREQLIETERHQMRMLNRSREMEQIQLLAELQREQETRKRDSLLLQQKFQEQNTNQVKNLSLKLREAETRQKQLEIEEQLKARERRCKIDLLFETGNLVTQQVFTSLRACKQTQHLSQETQHTILRIQDAARSLTTIREHCSRRDVMSEDVANAELYLRDLNDALPLVQKGVEEANSKVVEVTPVEEVKIPDVAPPQTAASGDAGNNSGLPNELLQCVPADALKLYVTLQDNLNKVADSLKEFTTTTAMKKLKFDLQKATNTPLNAIASTSWSHVRDKLDKLRRLLSGQAVEVGDKMVASGSHPLGRLYCMDLLARKFVKQGEDQVSAHFESAFPLAIVIVSLWSEFPDFGKLLMAQFHSKCPYLVPYYIPRQEGQDDEDHYRALGYIYPDGSIEKQDKFLKRMSGVVRLYASIITQQVPPGCNSPHPHGIQHGWSFITRLVKLVPHPDITATVLYDFLAVSGHDLQHTYGRQFNKILHAICKDFFPLLRKVSPEGGGGPLSRLESFLQNSIKKGQIPKPEGMLPSNFFTT